MMHRRNLFALLVFGAALALGYAEYGLESAGQGTTHNAPAAPEHDVGKIVVTKHGECRMACRHITMSEVREVIAQGNVNARKSDAFAKPCPVQAYEGRTSDGQLARIVVGECPAARKIITVIDLENKYRCACN